MPRGRPKGATQFPNCTMSGPQTPPTKRVRIPEDEVQVLGKNHERVFHVNKHPLVRKIFPHPRHGLREMFQELFALKVANRVGLATPKIAGWNALSTIPYAYLNYIEARDLSDQEELFVWGKMGETLAKIHALSPESEEVTEVRRLCESAGIPFPNVDLGYHRNVDQIVDRVDNIVRVNPFLGRIATVVCALLARSIHSVKTRKQIGLIHGNPLPGMILVGSDSECYVRDWQHSFFTDTKVELAMAVETALQQSDTEAVDRLITAYTAKGGDPSIEATTQDLAKLHRSLNLISSLARYRQAVSANSNHPRAQYIHIAARDYITDIETAVCEHLERMPASESSKYKRDFSDALSDFLNEVGDE